MAKSRNYQKQQKFLYWIIGFGIFFLLLANTLAWFYLQQIKTYFNSDLKFRLENIVQISSRLLDPSYLSTIVPGDENDPQIIYYQQLLFEIKEDNDLQDLYIISPAREILVDLNPEFTIGESKRTNEDSLIQIVLKGNIVSSDIYLLGDHKFLTAAAPLIDESNTVTAILIAEARAGFFDVIEQFNQGLILFSFINGLVILGVALFLFRSLKKLINLQYQIKNQEHLVKLGEMAAAVAHELRNPLGIIRGTNEIINKKYGNDDEFFQYIPAELDRLNQLINDFLSFARVRDLKYSNVDLHFLLQKIKISVSNEENINVIINIDENIKNINTDPDVLEQVLLNIFQNSIQSINEKGKIEFIVTKFGSKRIKIQVKDNGCGIKEESLKSVFEPFFSTKEKGSGLGLAISKRLVDQLGGIISVESHLNSCTTVSLMLPVLEMYK